MARFQRLVKVAAGNAHSESSMRRLFFGLAVVVACTVAAEVAGQQPPPPGLPAPRINNVFPCGAKIGASVEVSITGFDLDEPTGLWFSHAGIKAEYLPPKEGEPDPKKKDPAPKKKRQAAPPSGPFKFKIAVDAKVPPGLYDVRVVNKWGVSNPRVFAVGEFPEVNEKEPNNDVPEAQKVEIGTTINGVLQSPADVDYTQFIGKKGQRVIISCLTSSLDSRAKPMIEIFTLAGRKIALNRNYRDADALADVVLPDDGEYLVRLFEFTYQSGSPDHVYRLTISTAPWIDAVYPQAVEFGKPTTVTLYGRNLPGGQPSGFAIEGRPLEKAMVTITPPTDPLAAQRLAIRDRIEPNTAMQDGFEYSIKGPGGASNSVPIYFTREKAVLKKNPGGTKPESAEALTTPCEVVGMIHRRGDRDWYSFDAKRGDVLYIEATAERNGGTLDFYFNIFSTAMGKTTDVGGGEIDDETDQQNITLHPTEFYTRTSDPPAHKFTAPSDGKYLIAIGCRESGSFFGPQSAYRLRVGPPRPDFRAIVIPYTKSYQTGSSGRQDGTEAYEVFIHRLDGFNGSVTVTAEGLPAGVTAKPAVIGPGTKWSALVLDIGPTAAAFTGPITVKATATTPDGKPLVREVRPATVVWGVQPGQNIPVVARLTQSMVLAVRPEKGFFRVSADPAAAVIKPPMGKEAKASGAIVVKQGEKITVPVKGSWVGADKPNITLVAEPMLQNAQQGPVTVQIGGQPTMAKPDVTATIDVKATAPPGVYSIVLRGDAQVPFIRDPMAKGNKANLPASAFTDPIVFTVIPTSVAKITAGQLPNNTIKAGGTGELTIKIDRQFDYAGEFKVRFEAAKGAAGISAGEATVPAGKSEAKLVFKAAADAKPGAVAGVVIVTAVYDKKYTLTHEAKVNFNIAAADKKK
jgi:hypothetical protein